MPLGGIYLHFFSESLRRRLPTLHLFLLLIVAHGCVLEYCPMSIQFFFREKVAATAREKGQILGHTHDIITLRTIVLPLTYPATVYQSAF